ncbi:hypothetical protein R9C00_07420 [Flammeovirgaceae bacterium SG7u.111]|nr:hypothetical protein [Flammeovirgaceae bacterium SG7u.132]WPO37275.1 hypothetical protein R9C00_07420 [Flammeovirgaceae bacterium SG7u.111]
MDYKIDQRLFPGPIKNSAEKPEFEAAWQKFQDDFKKVLLDEALVLIFSSNSSYEI